MSRIVHNSNQINHNESLTEEEVSHEQVFKSFS